MKNCNIKRLFKHIVIFECDDAERVRFLFSENPYIDFEEASKILVTDFGFENCKIIQIDCLI